jgi:alpha-beta hydrolase superfamily lysophospholipase
MSVQDLDLIGGTILTMKAGDGVALRAHIWRSPESEAPRAVVQIVHGMAEHAGRYSRLALALNTAGYAVFGQDLRGHGRTAAGPDDLGFFAEEDGWAKCVDDLWQVNRAIARMYPDCPIILLAHSMGSFLAQDFIAQHGEALAGVVLSGSNGALPPTATLGKGVAWLERQRLGPRGRSTLLDRLGFGSFNRDFAPARTPLDWLSRDAAEVDKYIADPLCGGMSTTQLWIDLLGGLSRIADPGLQARIPKELPIHIIAGDRDPVTRNTKGLIQLIEAYRRVGLSRVTHRFYEGARHELFNETNRDEVTRDLILWLDGVVEAAL